MFERVRIIGYAATVEELLTVIVLNDDGTDYGVNGWVAKGKDRRIYIEATPTPKEGGQHEQED